MNFGGYKVVHGNGWFTNGPEVHQSSVLVSSPNLQLWNQHHTRHVALIRMFHFKNYPKQDRFLNASCSVLSLLRFLVRLCFRQLSLLNKIPLAGWLKQQKLYSHSFGDWKSQIRVPTWLLLRPLLLASRGHHSPCVLTW